MNFRIKEARMESVIEYIRKSKENKKTTHPDTYVYEAIVQGCQVKLRFNSGGDSAIMKNIRSMLLSSRFDSMLAAQAGGESA
jgi:hypothetical protein